MAAAPAEIHLEIEPRERVDVIDVSGRIRERFGDRLAEYPRALYCSLHTTAGYLEQSLSARLGHRGDLVSRFLSVFGRMFPPDADYSHDRIDLRTELSEEQRRTEPRNADSHLAFIGAGLRNCVVYRNQVDHPVWFVDLDGTHGSRRRRRQTTVIGFHRGQRVERLRLPVPVSGHRIDAVNLMDPRLGLIDQITEEIARHGIAKGRLDLSLDRSEGQAGLTVNEYETLLMKHDLAEVLRNPIRFVAEKGRHMWEDPRAIPTKTWNYAKYDLVRVVNELLDAVGARESLVESAVAKLFAVPASRFLRMKRSVTLLVSDHGNEGHPSVVTGTYQSPILVQWNRPEADVRWLDVTLTRLE